MGIIVMSMVICGGEAPERSYLWDPCILCSKGKK